MARPSADSARALVLGAGALALVVSSISGQGWINPATVAALTSVLWFAVAFRGHEENAPSLAMSPPLFVASYCAEEAAEGRGGSIAIAIGFAALFGFSIAFLSIRFRRPWAGGISLLLVLLALFSARAGGAENMLPLFRAVLPQNIVPTAIVLVRKSIHSTFYPLLAFAALRCLETAGKSRLSVIPWALGYALVFATFDEIRQASIPGRTGLASDVLIDMAAASLLMGVLFLRERKVQTRVS